MQQVATVSEAVINQLASDIHANALSKGFWEAPHPFIAEMNTKLMLIVSEVAEAMEVLRRSYDGEINPYSQMTEPQGAEFVEELSDVVIRALDLMRYFEGVHGNAAEIITAKMAKNLGRPKMHGAKRF